MLLLAAISAALAAPLPAPAPAPAPPGAGPLPMAAYTETIPDSDVAFEMIPIPGGRFNMGSPPGEKGRKKDEGPVHEVTLRPFWMSKTEITWDAYEIYLDIGMEKLISNDKSDEGKPDAITYSTPPYADETFGYGAGKQPAIALTWHAVMEFSRWVSLKTSKTYRLPTEAEWEYACRAGATTPYSFGANPRTISEYAFWKKNAKKRPQPVGQKKANAFGLLDMHGNVGEWVIDLYDAAFYQLTVDGGLAAGFPVKLPGAQRFSHVVRGGGWKDNAPALRCAARRFSEPWWSKQDPQNPRSIWWHTESTDVGFRLVRVPDEYPQLKGTRSRMTRESR